MQYNTNKYLFETPKDNILPSEGKLYMHQVSQFISEIFWVVYVHSVS